MILFATDNELQPKFQMQDLQTVSLEKGFEVARSIIDKQIDFTNEIYTGLDSETNGLDPYKNTTLLLQLGTAKHQVVFDVTDGETKVKTGHFIEYYNNIVRWLGANIKFDYNMLAINHGVRLKKMWDVMVSEQRIFQNMDYSYALAAIYERYTKTAYVPMDKSVTDEFIGANPLRHIFTERQIRYSARDIYELFPIKDKQLELVDKYGLQFLLSDDLEMGLIHVLSEMELEGLRLNVDLWKKTIEENEDEKFELECDLDEKIRNLRDILLQGEDRRTLIGGIYDQIRKRHPKIISTDLFGGEVTFAHMQKGKGKVKMNVNNVNYSSPLQMTKLFGNLKQQMPTKFGKYAIPIIKARKNKQGSILFKVTNTDEKFSTKKEYLEQYVLRFPKSPMTPFVQNLIKLRKVTKRIDSFGEQFIRDYIHTHTGKVHTVFRQCMEIKQDGKEGKSPINGRLSSGDVKKLLPNMQNIPRDKRYRKAFYTDPGYSIITCDLSGAEVTVMASKGKDTKLLEYVNKEIFHDYAATQGWRRIFLQRANELAQRTELRTDALKIEHKQLLDNVNNFVVSKTENPELRQIGKNMHFGIFYGLREKKGSETLNITREEAKVYIDFIRKAFPKTVSKLKEYEDSALTKGYLIIDERTNARIWFPKIVRTIQHNRQVARENSTIQNKAFHKPYAEIDFMDAVEIGGQARNIPVSGSQANMLKEAMVEIYRYNKEHNLDCKFLLQVHDELVIRCPKNMDGKSLEWEEDPHYVYFKPDNPIYLKDDEMREYYKWDKYDIEISKNVKSLTIFEDKLVGWWVDYPRFVALTMCEVANRYLNGFKMRAEYHVEDTWIK